MKFGEPSCSVAVTERVKQVIVGNNQVMTVGYYSFSRIRDNHIYIIKERILQLIQLMSIGFAWKGFMDPFWINILESNSRFLSWSSVNQLQKLILGDFLCSLPQG